MTPRHDPPRGRKPRPVAPHARSMARLIEARRRRGRDRPDAGGEPCPVEPNRPIDLSGGAAAALEFDR